MPTFYTDQFYNIDPLNPPPVGSSVTWVSYQIRDNNNDGEVDPVNGDRINDARIDSSWPDSTVTVDVPGKGQITYTGTLFYLRNGQTVFTPTDGQFLNNGTFVSATRGPTQGPLLVPSELGPPCFTTGTSIDTPGGGRLVEDLRPGDLVLTLDNGPQAVRWTGRRTCSAAELAGNPALRPIRIAAGTLGDGLPTADLLVSPQHRVLIRSKIADRMSGSAELLVAAKHLVGVPGISVAGAGAGVTYVHLLFDRHEIVFSNGAPSETLYTGAEAMKALGRAARDEIVALFPELEGEAARAGARPLATGRIGRKLAQRHARNCKPLLAGA